MPTAPVSERTQGVFPESFGEGNSNVLIGTILCYIPLDKRMCLEMKRVDILYMG